MASNVASVPVTADKVVASRRGTYYGLTFRETSGTTAATIIVYDNASAASGTVLDNIQLVAGESRAEWYGPQGISSENGIYVDVTGDVVGSVRHG